MVSVEAALVAVERAVVGSRRVDVDYKRATGRRVMDSDKEKLLNEFVERMRKVAGTNLQSVILYGSAAAGDYVSEHSDVNLLCLLGETSFAAIQTIAPVIEWWGALKHRPPLLLSAEEVTQSVDVFSIEFLDMRRNYKLLFGNDALKTLEIPMRWHRAQLEYELREKTILLRQRLLTVSGDNAKWDLLLHSVPAFGTLFRHSLIALGDLAPGSTREAANALAGKLNIDISSFQELLDIRERKTDRSSVKVDEIFARYLKLVQEATSAVNQMLDPAA